MPYQLEFKKQLAVEDIDLYFNECCIGGDQVTEILLPLVREGYSAIQHEQEDWGWFIWFRRNKEKLAIDVFCDDPESGSFRIFLTSRKKGRFFGYKVTDTNELEVLKSKVAAQLNNWADSPISETRLDEDYAPVDLA